MNIRINLENIQTLTDFKRNAKEYVERIKLTNSPLVLTVNGKAEVVIHEAHAFQQMLDRLQYLEEELKKVKLQALKQEISIGIKQLDSGDYTEYDEESLGSLFEDIKARGRQKLVEPDTL
ncbi:MAG: type II toxin-antitoxin system Phd/YefM family antitoxin [Desmonostoc vinosum HA7617-LM4]|jgi:PHD/YefM family antitoxin component YafN of YafNO toxin-antitoxin module|nr:type II toxin-antitoxin system Phd/YefM family antitoxin [Desmonostoc vinosum HA7617-LM4]